MKLLKNVPFLLVAILVGVTVAYAGSLTPPSSVTDTMYSLTNLFNLSTGTTATLGSGAIETTPTSIIASGKTLTQVYTAISDEVAKLSTAKIASGTTAFNITGKTSVVDTENANATVADIISPKTAYVNGVKIIGEATAGTNYGIPKTGQAHCNAITGGNPDDGYVYSQVPCTGTKQDGDSTYKKGLARSYTDIGVGTMKDNATGLLWQKCSAGQDPLDCSGDATTLVFDDGAGHFPAIDYCENLSLATFSDWRLPNVNELQSLVDYGRVGPAIDPVFLNTQSGSYWSSTAYEGSAGFAWVVNFVDGDVGGNDLSNSSYVRCVRGN